MIFECPTCPREFGTVEAFRSHLLPVHGAIHGEAMQPHPRAVRQAHMLTSTYRRPTQETSSIIRLFICPSCNRVYQHIDPYRHHYREAHISVRSSSPIIRFVNWDDHYTGLWECKTCGRDFLSRQRWADHYHKRHAGRNGANEGCLQRYQTGFRFECPISGCGWVFKRYASCLYHFDRFHPDAETEWREPQYVHTGDIASDPAFRSQPPTISAPTLISQGGPLESAQRPQPDFIPPIFDPAPTDLIPIDPSLLESLFESPDLSPINPEPITPTPPIVVPETPQASASLTSLRSVNALGIYS